VRRSLAALVIVLLVAMTSWAAACDLSCSIGQFHSVCMLDGGAMPSGAQVRSSSDVTMDPNMAMPEGASVTQTNAENRLVSLHANSCAHSPCNETSVSSISKSAITHPVRALPVIAFERLTVPAIAAQGSRLALEREPNPPPFDPLSISLRI
jgi:hypothetical protein